MSRNRRLPHAEDMVRILEFMTNQDPAKNIGDNRSLKYHALVCRAKNSALSRRARDLVLPPEWPKHGHYIIEVTPEAKVIMRKVFGVKDDEKYTIDLEKYELKKPEMLYIDMNWSEFRAVVLSKENGGFELRCVHCFTIPDPIDVKMQAVETEVEEEEAPSPSELGPGLARVGAFAPPPPASDRATETSKQLAGKRGAVGDGGKSSSKKSRIGESAPGLAQPVPLMAEPVPGTYENENDHDEDKMFWDNFFHSDDEGQGGAVDKKNPEKAETLEPPSAATPVLAPHTPGVKLEQHSSPCVKLEPASIGKGRGAKSKGTTAEQSFVPPPPPF